MKISIILPALLLIACPCCAETIVLKSGDKIEATVVEKNSGYVRINFKGADIFYRVSEIAAVDGKPLEIPKTALPADKSLAFMLKSKGIKDDLASSDTPTAADYLKRGFVFYSKDNNDQAVTDLTRAIKANPGMIEAYLYRGLTYMKKDEPDKAIEDYNRAIGLNPKNEEAYYVRGLAYAGKKDTDSAMRDYNTAIDLNPKYVQAYLNRGIINLGRNELEKTIADMVRVMEINDKLPSAYYIRALAYANENNIQQAIADYDEAIRLKPDYAEAYMDRALAYAYKKKIEESKTDRNSPAAYINIGLNQLSKEDYDKALSDCAKAIEISPRLAAGYLTRARIYMMGNDYDKAWADIHKSDELGGKMNKELLESLKMASGRDK